MTAEKQFRYFRTRAEDLSDANGERTLSVSFSSETPVLRRDRKGEPFYEVLSHDPKHADLSLVQGGGAFLDEHMNHRQIGSVQKAWLDTKERKGRATLGFADTPLGNERFELMASGHRRDISFGYSLTRVLSETKAADGKPVRRFAWQAFEISSVSVGADHFETGVGRSRQDQIAESKIKIMDTENSTTEMVAIERAILHDHPHLDDQIKAFHARALCEDLDLKAYKRGLIEIIDKNPRRALQRVPVAPGAIGMEQRDLKNYSIARAIRSIAENKKLEGFELDCHQQCERSSKMSAEGFFVPLDVVMGSPEQRSLGTGRRDLTAGEFGAGGALVPELLQTPIIELLRNRTAVLRLGATRLGGLTGNISVPRQTSPATAKSLPETAAIDQSQPTFDQILMTPHRVGAFTVLSKQLIIQSTPDVEAFVLSDLSNVIALKHDSLALNGQGANDEPMGVLNRQDVGTVAFGATATWAKVVAFETALGNANADFGQMAYITTPTVRGAWKTIAIALTGATTVSANPLWQTGNFNDGTNDGVVNGYRACATNQIPNNKVLFGNMNDLVFAMWGGLDLVVNPYTRAKQAEIEITVNTWIDVALRHAQSFCVSTDAGNQ